MRPQTSFSLTRTTVRGQVDAYKPKRRKWAVAMPWETHMTMAAALPHPLQRHSSHSQFARFIARGLPNDVASTVGGGRGVRERPQRTGAVQDMDDVQLSSLLTQARHHEWQGLRAWRGKGRDLRLRWGPPDKAAPVLVASSEAPSLESCVPPGWPRPVSLVESGLLVMHTACPHGKAAITHAAWGEYLAQRMPLRAAEQHLVQEGQQRQGAGERGPAEEDEERGGQQQPEQRGRRSGALALGGLPPAHPARPERPRLVRATAVEKDTTTNSCVVTLRTTVNLTDTRLHVAPNELEELAWLAVRDAAADAVSALNRQSSLSAVREERHGFVYTMLQDGTIRDAKRMENGFGHVSYLVTLEDKATGKKVRAAFKPRVEGDCEGWHRVPIEVAAYQLNLLLGMDVVPPAVMRQDCDVDWTHYPSGGAFIYWCSAARQLNTVPMQEWSVPGPVLLSDTRILDVLLQNSDRHAGHFLYAEHWADGDYAPQTQTQPSQKGGGGPPAWRGRMSPVLIDHAAGFRQDAFVCLDHENAFLTGPTRHISARTYLRLRFLDGPSLRSALHGVITDEEVAALLSRRDAVLSFFDGLVSEQGYENVVLEV